jgi:hypothetical protein
VFWKSFVEEVVVVFCLFCILFEKEKQKEEVVEEEDC